VLLWNLLRQAGAALGPTVGTASCQVEHAWLVLRGQAIARMDDGTEWLMKAGGFFYIPPGHDSWLVSIA
jgi:quercetin dioxygenase-like cupin family protein